jgi:esterase FrsA
VPAVYDVAELKQFVELHARAHGIAPKVYREVLEGVRTDAGDGPDSWVGRWRVGGDRLAAAGNHAGAAAFYNMARFPCVDGPARAEALARCVASFERSLQDRDGIERLDVQVDGGTIGCWTAGLSTSRQLPLLLVMGGIVSLKEQWAPALRRIGALGMAGIVTEMPGVGENPLRYGPDSWRMLPAVLDAVRDRADVDHTYAMTMSFSGHLALRCALDDSRIRGIVTAGAPIHHFFTDPVWRPRVPRITMDTLAHLTGCTPAALDDLLPTMALSGEHLTGVDVPVAYVVSNRDEIIPASDVDFLRRHVRQVRLLTNDDVHGSPNHLPETQLWIILSILRMRGRGSPQRTALTGLMHAARARRRVEHLLPGNRR